MSDTAFAYLRISTKENEDKQNLVAQRHAIEEWSERTGIPIRKWYEDEASAIDMKNRKQWHRMLQDIENWKEREHPNRLVMYKLDRGFRSIKGSLETILDLHENHHMRLVTLDGLLDHMDLSRAIGQILFNILVGFAQLEREFISDRTKAGILASQAGKGRNLHDDGTVKVFRSRSPLIYEKKNEIIQLYEDGWSIRRIAKEFLGGIPQSSLGENIKQWRREGLITRN